MIEKRNNFILDHIQMRDVENKKFNLPVNNGLTIKYKDNTEIAKILWDDQAGSCYIRTINNNLQTYIVLYDDYKDFICLVDEAFFDVSLMHGIRLVP